MGMYKNKMHQLINLNKENQKPLVVLSEKEVETNNILKPYHYYLAESAHNALKNHGNQKQKSEYGTYANSLNFGCFHPTEITLGLGLSQNNADIDSLNLHSCINGTEYSLYPRQ